MYFPLSPHHSPAWSPVSAQRVGTEEPGVTAPEMEMFLSESSLVVFPEDVLDLLKCLLVSPDCGPRER